MTCGVRTAQQKAAAIPIRMVVVRKLEASPFEACFVAWMLRARSEHVSALQWAWLGAARLQVVMRRLLVSHLIVFVDLGLHK